MARSSASKGSASAEALTTTQQSGAAVVLDELAEAGIELDADAEDGLSEASGEDLKIASKVFNMKGKGADGRKIPEDAFYDTIDQTVKDRINAVFLYLHKSNVYSYYDNEDSRTVIVCRSFDRVTGTLEETGEQRPCKGCPDDEWRTEGGKRKKNCGAVYNVASLDRDTSMPFWLRFKRTSLPVIKTHLQRHHLGRRIVQGKRVNYPLFAFAVDLSCTMSDDGKYALPVIQRGQVLSSGEMHTCREAAAAIKENVIPMLTASDAQVADTVRDADTSFDPETFGGAGQAPAGGTGAGDDFTE